MQAVDVIEGAVTLVDRSDIDTDQILPARYLRRVERTGFGQYLFADWREAGQIELRPNPVLVAGANFGCGSSREHAVWALYDYGFRAVVSPSFGDIFANNAVKVGLVPVALPESAVRSIAAAGRIRIDLPNETVSAGSRQWRLPVDQDTKKRLVGGLDDIAMTLSREADIDRFEASRLVDTIDTTSLH
ncbi:3-isopropylmalate dehydratase small subunit [Pseudonocardia alni]|uniref:3-isopropylmalate dehydratase small subunit n=1 Tax=Pseudonocardia alni TaxID=33907 RepID=UPI00280C1CD7|nr:3-isopropylmalate dehydratase small subunit [Pseudonocardia alni]